MLVFLSRALMFVCDRSLVGTCRGAGMYRATPGCGLASSPGALVARRAHMSFPVAACAISPYLQALTPRSLLSPMSPANTTTFPPVGPCPTHRWDYRS